MRLGDPLSSSGDFRGICCMRGVRPLIQDGKNASLLILPGNCHPWGHGQSERRLGLGNPAGLDLGPDPDGTDCDILGIL